MQQDPQQPQPYQPQPYQQPMGYPPQMPQPPKKNFFRTIPGIITGLIIVCCVASAIAVAASKGGGSTTPGNGGSGNANNSQATATPAASPTATHTPKWTTIQTYSGNGSKKTGTFSVPDDWRIVWSCDPSSFYGGQYNVIVGVDNSDGSFLDPAAVNTICKTGNTGDNTEEHQGGNVYLDINSEGSWTVKVQVLK
jgi:hypothetical protein